MSVTDNNGDGLADFILGLPEGERHKGFFWAAATAAEDNLPPGEVAKVAKAGIDVGLGEAYVNRTLAEVLKPELGGVGIHVGEPAPVRIFAGHDGGSGCALSLVSDDPADAATPGPRV